MTLFFGKLLKKAWPIMCGVVALAFLPDTAQGQYYFGKNKVQYEKFDWQLMETDHFRIYFYTDEQKIASIAARLAEDSYEVLATKFNHEVERKIPFIVYSSPSYFSQTNVIPGLLPESVGGFTEFMKGRVVVPFNGSHFDFDHVIRHELVHVFMLDRLDKVLDRRSRSRYEFPPLWFTEGIAEFWSKEWDADADMVVRDMVIDGRLYSIDNMYRIQGTYFMYKLGESICQFIDSEYGSDKLSRIFDNWHKGRTFDEVVKITLGDNLSELSRKWEYSQQKRCMPDMEYLGLPKMESDQLTFRGLSDQGVPIKYDDGNGPQDWIVYKANRLGYSGIYMKPAKSSKRGGRTLLKGERSAALESLYLLRSGIDASDSGLVVFASKSKEHDVVYLYDLSRGRLTERYEIDSLVTAHSPRFSPDAKRVVFTGTTVSGFADLYLLELGSGDYRRLTDDLYYELDPAFSVDGKSVIFSSNRCVDGPKGALNLFELNLDSADLTQLTFGNYRDRTPDPTSLGIFFSSDRSGTYNLFALDSSGRLSQQTSVATAAVNPRLNSDGTKLVYTGFQDMTYQIYQTDIPEDQVFSAQRSTVAAEAWLPEEIDQRHEQTTVRYDTDYSLDIAQSMVGYDPVYGALGGVQLAVSDMLGDHAYHILLTNTATNKDDLIESFNGGVTYVNRQRRINWGVGAFHLYDEYYNDFDGHFYERQAGLISLFSYPLSKFTRVDLTSLARYSKRDHIVGIPLREVFLATNYISLIHDNSIWDISGPIDGHRYNLTAGITTAVDEGEVYARTALADLRHYFRLGRYSAFATRLFCYTSAGIEPQRVYLGGSWSFRGYNRRAWYNRNVLFASNELRFPLIDNLFIGFPIGALGFSSIRGALFFDAGSAWDDYFDQYYGSFGGGVRVSLGYLVLLRLDFTRTTDFETISPDTEFDFFFGWNF